MKTIRLPKPSILDHILRAMGKKRAVYIPLSQGEKGQYAYMVARKESFLRALLRPRSRPLPEGCVDVFEIVEY
jgi:hypothetical protein